MTDQGSAPGTDRGAERWTAAVAWFAVVAIAGYAAHRLAGAPGEPDPRTVGPSTHIPYYWRSATALWWGALAAAGGWRFPVTGQWAARALPWVVFGAVVAAFLVP